jgi:hypothetical protein
MACRTAPGCSPPTARAWLARVELPAVARQAVDLAVRRTDHAEVELDTLDTALARGARGQPGCKALMGRYGIGWLTAVAIWAEFGDVGRFANARQAVRFTGLDVTVSESDGKRARGHLARQGSPVLRWALYEAATCAARPTPPDHADYLAVKQRLAANAPRCRWRASSPARPTTPWVRSAARRSSRLPSSPPPRELVDDRARSGHPTIGVVRPAPWCSCRHALVVDGLHRTSGRTRHVREPDHPPRRRTTGPSTQIRLDTRALRCHPHPVPAQPHGDAMA